MKKVIPAIAKSRTLIMSFHHSPNKQRVVLYDHFFVFCFLVTQDHFKSSFEFKGINRDNKKKSFLILNLFGGIVKLS